MDLGVNSLFGYLEERKSAGKQRPLLTSQEALGIFAAVLDAVEVLHTHEPKIIHRDVNPSNVLLMRDGRWVLADFGLAKFLSTSAQLSELTRTRVGLGTAFYAAPEQWEDLKRTDEAADIFALGILLWELFTRGGLPPEADQLPEPLATVFRRATRREPAERYNAVAELRNAFRLSMLFMETNEQGSLVTPHLIE
jgi:serine/threonine protein kinase